LTTEEVAGIIPSGAWPSIWNATVAREAGRADHPSARQFVRLSDPDERTRGD
jgi:hypothetical protein